MRRSASAAAGALLIACGGAPPPGGIDVQFSEQALLERADRIAIYFYDRIGACDTIRPIYPRPASALGPYLAVLDEDGRAHGIKFERSDVPAGLYLVWADALGGAGELIGSGCSPNQRVLDRKSSRIQVVINNSPI